jgi:tetratricopeptide (TPR) repeat protein
LGVRARLKLEGVIGVADEQLTPQRQEAQKHFRQAMEQAKRGRMARALELAELAIETDPSYLECRRWLAERYEELGETRKASRHLQEIVYQTRDDSEAWAALERVDPAAAARLRRVAQIAPDPFVARRRRPEVELSELEDMEEVEEVAFSPAGVSEEGWVPVHEGPEELEELEELGGLGVEEEPAAAGERREAQIWLEEPGAEEEVAAAPAGAPAPAASQPPAGPKPWEHEQDRPYRDKMLQDELLKAILQRIGASWESPESWRPVLDVCAHASRQSHAELWAAAEAAAEVLGSPMPALLVVPEASPHGLPLREPEREIAVHTGLLRCMQGAQLVFALGRLISMFLAGQVPFFHAALLVTDRPLGVLGTCEEAVKEHLWDLLGAWFESHPKEQRERAAALAHAWQLRCELSCDRAGLLACGNLEAACNAVAYMTLRSPSQASTMTWRTLVEKYKGQDLGQLAAIPVKADPRYHEGYAVYRIQTLRWWFTTDEYRALAERYRLD